MGKQILRNYEFDADARTITFPDFDEPMDQARLALVTNVRTGELLYNFMDPTLRGELVGNVLTLEKDTAGMQDDPIRIDYDTSFGDVAYDRMVVGNARTKFRDGFATPGTQPNPDTWILEEDTPGLHIINQGGDSSGSSYLRISLDPFTEGDSLSLTSKRRFAFPMRIGWGISTSQRIFGQEMFVGVVGVDDDGTIPQIEPTVDQPITGATASVTSNVATFTLTNHGLKGGDRINILNCADHRMNVGPAIVTVVNADQFTVPITIANASYSTVGGIIRVLDPFGYARNAYGYVWSDSTSVTTAGVMARRNGAKFRNTAVTVATVTAAQSNTSPYTDAFNSAGNQELYMSMDECVARSYASDSNASTNGYLKYTQGIPDEELQYALQFRARIYRGFTRPIARVVSASKAGTTTATVTTDVPHNLAVGDFVQVYGTRDQTNFANMSTQTVIASVPSATTFTLVWGTAVTASTAGGTVFVNHGQVAAPGVFGQSVQSISRTSNVLTLIGNTNWATPLPGEYVNVYGLEPAASAYEGAYKVLRATTTTLELEAPGPNFGSITTGGAVIRRTDIRLHFARVMDYTRLVAEVVSGRGNVSDVNGALPVAITGSATVPASQTTGANTTIWNAAGWGGYLVADHASAALTATNTGGAVTPGSVANIGVMSNTFHIGVTAISGSGAYMDVAVEESPDNGTTWVRLYEFPRITATGNYYSPQIRGTFGTRYRYIRTIGGTTPSVTNVVNRIQWSHPGEIIRQWFDRTVNLTTLNSTTPAFMTDGCNFFQTTVSLGAATTSPNLLLQGSEDGGSWYNIGATWTPAANAQTLNVQANVALPKFVRVLVQTAGSAVTTNWVSLKAAKI